MKRINKDQMDELRYLTREFKYLFDGKIDPLYYTQVITKFSIYACDISDDSLRNFVEEYSVMSKHIISNRNNLLDYINSKEYEDAGLIEKLKTRKVLRHWQRLCENLNSFEDKFYEKTNISLLRVENERLFKENTKESVVEQN